MEQFLTIQQVAEKLMVSKCTVERMVKRGDIRAYKLGKPYCRKAPVRIDPKDLRKFLERNVLCS